MRRKLFSNKAFLIGFTSGILFFLFINAFMIWMSSCHHCVNIAGFPIVFYEKFVGTVYYTPVKGISYDNFEYFYIWRLAADILIAIISSFVLGLILKLIWSKFASRRLNLR